MKNNDNPALLAHKQAYDADRRAIAENKRRANVERIMRMVRSGPVHLLVAGRPACQAAVDYDRARFDVDPAKVNCDACRMAVAS